jgi:hypothetical protein
MYTGMFPPAPAAPNYEAARQVCVRLMRDYLAGTGDSLDGRVAALLRDEVLADLSERWPRVRRERNGRVGIWAADGG